MGNIFDLPLKMPSEECFEPLVSSEQVLIKRIISTGQTTPVGEWYNQERDKWVILLQGNATLNYTDGSIPQTYLPFGLLYVLFLLYANFSLYFYITGIVSGAISKSKSL